MLGINECNGISPEGGAGGDFPASTFPPNLMRDRSTTFFPGGLFDVNISGDDPIGYYDGNQFVYLGRDVSASDVADRYGETDRIYNRSEEHTSELQSLMRTSYAVFCLKKKKQKN